MVNYRTRILSSLAQVSRAEWDDLVAQQDGGNLFLSHAYLDSLHECGCASAATGWQPQFVTIWDGERLQAALPLYLKFHSYGEYVFDWAWADAYRRNGLDYYPKLLSAIPFTPVAGARLLARTEHARTALIDALVTLQADSGVSSTHILFATPAQAENLRCRDFLLRTGVQFHWSNAGYGDFEQFLATLDRKKRKNIRAERRAVVDAGVRFRQLPGAAIRAQDWEFFYRCYAATYAAHYSTPYLTLDFFRRIGNTMPQHVRLFIAEQASEPIAASLVFHDSQTLYGRYWGALRTVPCLHFEAAYYQPMEFCIDAGIQRFEGGAQGEHKLARGFLPDMTWSAHWLAHPAFADAIDRFLAREGQSVAAYMDELRDRSPFKTVKYS